MKKFFNLLILFLSQSYFITSLDGHMVNSPELKEVRSNFTAIRLMSAMDVEALNIINQWKEKKKYLNAEQYRVAQRVSAVSYDRLKVNLISYPSRQCL